MFVAAVLAVFAFTWVLIAFRRLRWLPIGRPAGALAGAVGMIAVGALSFDEAWRAVDGGTLGLLLGMMLVTAYLQRAGLFAWAAHHLVPLARTPIRLLVAVAAAAAGLSAVLVNDTVCLFLTPLVLGIVVRAGLPPGPFLVTLATSANLGSALTLVGNPQNMLVGTLSGLSFSTFTGAVLPAVIAAFAVHLAVLWGVYRRQLGEVRETPLGPAPVLAPDAPLTAIVFAGLLLAFTFGVHLGFAALAGAVALLILDRREPTEAFAAVDWSLLLFFAGLFVVVRGLSTTGLPDHAWTALAPHTSLEGPGLVAITAALTLGSNVVSNVPLVLLVGERLATLGDPTFSWVLLAFVTTVAGNLTLVGSVANVIVAEQAKGIYELSFWEYLTVGVPSTVLALAVGVPILAWWV